MISPDAEHQGIFLYSLIHSADRCLFDQGVVIHHRIVEPETTGKVIGFKAVTLQNPGGDVAAQTALADHIDGFSGFDLPDSLPQFVHRDISEAFDVSTAVLAHCPGIQ